MPKTYNTPKRNHIIKTRLDDDEHTEFLRRMELYGMSQSEFIRQAVSGAPVKPIITVHPVNDQLLSVIGKLTAEYGRIGNNLNQIAAKAHTLNALDVQRYDENCRKLDEAIKTITAAVILPRQMK